MKQSKNIILFIGNDYVANIFLNQTIGHLIAMGLNPILIAVQSTCVAAHDFSEMKRYKFYENEILNNHIYPYLENLNNKQFIAKSFDQIVRDNNLQVIKTNNINDKNLINQIAKIDFIGAISVRCFQIFKKDIIETIKEKGFFCNSHPGILPNYKGVYCLLRGLVNGDKKLGWTLHEIDCGIDTGKVIKEIPFYDFNNKSMITILAKTVSSLSLGWVDFINSYQETKTISSQSQQSSGHYYTYPTENEISSWINSGVLQKISAKEMVQFYFDMFVADEDRLKPFAQQFKVFLINKVAQFETMLEMENQKTQDGYKKAA